MSNALIQKKRNEGKQEIVLRAETPLTFVVADNAARLPAEALAPAPESIEQRERMQLERRLARPLGSDLGERPTKQDRRRLDALRKRDRA